MLGTLSRAQWAGAWLAAVIVIFACSVVVGGPAISTSGAALWLVACFAPPAVMLLVWRGAAPEVVRHVRLQPDGK